MPISPGPKGAVSAVLYEENQHQRKPVLSNAWLGAMECEMESSWQEFKITSLSARHRADTRGRTSNKMQDGVQAESVQQLEDSDRSGLDAGRH